MAWLPMYLDHPDVGTLVDWLSSEEEIAFLVPTGVPHGWKAVARVPALPDGRYALWHVPAGPLPVFGPSHALRPSVGKWIDDPWGGWVELAPGGDRGVPYFGAECPATLYLNLRVKPTWPGAEGGLGVSSFEWVGNHYRIIGNGASPSTERWWQRLKRFVKKNAIRIPRGGPLEGPRAEIWAFPGARQAYEQGRPLSIN